MNYKVYAKGTNWIKWLGIFNDMRSAAYVAWKSDSTKIPSFLAAGVPVFLHSLWKNPATVCNM